MPVKASIGRAVSRFRGPTSFPVIPGLARRGLPGRNRVAHGGGLFPAIPTGRLPFSGWLLLLALCSLASVRASGEVVVESLDPASPAAKAGMAPGDVLLSWSLEGGKESGAIGTVFDFETVERDFGPRGSVALSGTRDGKAASWTLPAPPWGVRGRPSLGEDLLKPYAEGKELLDQGSAAKAAEAWSRAAAVKGAPPAAACWLELRAGEAWLREKKWDEALAAFARARTLAQGAGDASAVVAALERLGPACKDKSLYDRAEEAFTAEAEACRKAWGDGLCRARALSRLGNLEWTRRDLAAAEKSHQQALEIRERLAPGSLDVAESLNGLGTVAFSGADLERAREYFSRALAIQEKLVPGGSDAAKSLSNLGVIARNQGELAACEAYCKRALAIQEKLAPGSLSMANTLNTLGLVAHERGDLEEAERYHLRALGIREQKAPGSAYVAGSLNNLGGVAEARGDLERAEAYYEKAVPIMEKLAPDSLDLAACLSNCGVVAGRLGDQKKARAYYERALAIEEKIAPESRAVAGSYLNLGLAALAAGDLKVAEEDHRRALALFEKTTPGSVSVAQAQVYLGRVLGRKGDPGGQEACIQRALPLLEKLAPGSMLQAEALHDLGGARLARKDLQGGAKAFLAALDALEAQAGMLGGAQEVQATYRGEAAGFYRDAVGALMELKREREAFTILERSRARTLLEMLAARDLDFGSDVPPGLEKERRRLAREYDKAQAQLLEADPEKEAKAVDGLVLRLKEIRNQQALLAGKIRAASPRYAALRYPDPLDLAGAQKALEPGVALLSYCVMPRETVLFLVTTDDFKAFRLPAGDQGLRDKVVAFRESILRVKGVSRSLVAITAQGTELYALLVKPAEEDLARSYRLLLVPDGALHVLPFAALVRGRDKGYLAQWKPLFVAPSATAYAQLAQLREKPGAAGGRVAAFGDPRYAPDSGQAEASPVPVLLGTELVPLPTTREEVAAIRALAGERAALYQGEEATEERAKAELKKARGLHFACHGILDERLPLNSGLALTPPAKGAKGAENGLFQAWEVFECGGTNADLVVLSACETGLGKEAGGEGLLGLVRAFQYAGARSVVATLWRVADRSTTDFMTRFYGYLAKDYPKHMALRSAQADLIAGPKNPGDPDFSAPFYWAAFELYGDWK